MSDITALAADLWDDALASLERVAADLSLLFAVDGSTGTCELAHTAEHLLRRARRQRQLLES